VTLLLGLTLRARIGSRKDHSLQFSDREKKGERNILRPSDSSKGRVKEGSGRIFSTGGGREGILTIVQDRGMEGPG